MGWQLRAGNRYGKWTVLESINGSSHSKVRCQCDCGTVRSIALHSLIKGISRSCGCKKGRVARDRIGERFGLWTVVGPLQEKLLPCVCDCGTERLVQASNLVSGKSTSCGCEKNRKTSQRFRKHGAGYGDYRYRLWQTIKGKCLCETHKDWPHYGGRGIGIHESWIDDFPAFAAYLDAELGPRPDSYTLDRIDNESGYVPGNLRWATRAEQARNRRNRWRTE